MGLEVWGFGFGIYFELWILSFGFSNGSHFSKILILSDFYLLEKNDLIIFAISKKGGSVFD